MATLDDFDDDVQYYDHILEQLKHSQEYKARKFIEHDCIAHVEDDIYTVGPIPGYNTRTYTVQLTSNQATCNCQYSVMQRRKGYEGFCSHIAAVLLFLGQDTHRHEPDSESY